MTRKLGAGCLRLGAHSFRLKEGVKYAKVVIRSVPHVRGPWYLDGELWRATAWDDDGDPVTLVPWEDEE